jgi:hypothetical protein
VGVFCPISHPIRTHFPRFSNRPSNGSLDPFFQFAFSASPRHLNRGLPADIIGLTMPNKVLGNQKTSKIPLSHQDSHPSLPRLPPGVPGANPGVPLDFWWEPSGAGESCQGCLVGADYAPLPPTLRWCPTTESQVYRLLPSTVGRSSHSLRFSDIFGQILMDSSDQQHLVM